MTLILTVAGDRAFVDLSALNVGRSKFSVDALTCALSHLELGVSSRLQSTKSIRLGEMRADREN
jgi:hypothetical protein